MWFPPHSSPKGSGNLQVAIKKRKKTLTTKKKKGEKTGSDVPALIEVANFLAADYVVLGRPTFGR